MTLKRKKWTEEEERSLIDKYAEMQSDGILSRMRTREKRFRPIASHVNAGHHSINPVAYPFLWSWKDASTKVQNMRHQYLLVKQKILSSSNSTVASAELTAEETDWSQGLSLWPNFLRYRHVFGDAPLPTKLPDPPSSNAAAEPLASAADADGDLSLGLRFDCSDEDGGFDYEEAPPSLLLPQPHPPPPLLSERIKKKKRRRREVREWARVSAALAELREREERLEEREQESAQWAHEEEERDREARDAEELERLRRREEEEREWEDRMERRRMEWRKRMEVTMEQHRAEMEQIQARVLHEQQTVMNQLIGIISHWAAAGGGGGGGDIAGMGGGSGGGGQHYESHMMQGMHHVNGMVPEENRAGSDGPEDQFIVDD